MSNLDIHSLDFDCECGKAYRVLVQERNNVPKNNLERAREGNNRDLNHENETLKKALLEMCNHAKSMEFHILNHEGYVPAHLAMWPRDACAGIDLLGEKRKRFVGFYRGKEVWR